MTEIFALHGWPRGYVAADEQRGGGAEARFAGWQQRFTDGRGSMSPLPPPPGIARRAASLARITSGVLMSPSPPGLPRRAATAVVGQRGRRGTSPLTSGGEGGARTTAADETATRPQRSAPCAYRQRRLSPRTDDHGSMLPRRSGGEGELRPAVAKRRSAPLCPVRTAARVCCCERAVEQIHTDGQLAAG